ncbi:Polysialic acid transport protein kpsM [Kluyvera cryocrescens]|uniref:Polysialic acid transport protein kpsM n=1 Tax=Kluyvera cryocrescens TaxID=580 RepID=A0A485BHK4_KLUCR|nr:Polysialic acid transport protein kpsM [Kluyvera cryocrescens]
MARSGLEVQQAVIKALFMREIKTRFGKYRLGYLWAVLEPAAHLMVMVGIFGYIMHRTMPDISFPVFLINGIIPYFIFSNITNRSISAIEANQGLFNYRPVKPIDTIIARAILEIAIYIFVYITLMLFLGVLGEDMEISGIIVLTITWFFFTLFFMWCWDYFYGGRECISRNREVFAYNNKTTLFYFLHYVPFTFSA